MTLTNLFSLKTGTEGHSRLIYAGLLGGLLVPGLNVVAVGLAYLNRGKGGEVMASHTLNQIHIFWKSVAYVCTGLVLTYFLFGVLLIIAAIVWYILRVVKGLKRLAADAPIDAPSSWLA